MVEGSVVDAARARVILADEGRVNEVGGGERWGHRVHGDVATAPDDTAGAGLADSRDRASVDSHNRGAVPAHRDKGWQDEYEKMCNGCVTWRAGVHLRAEGDGRGSATGHAPAHGLASRAASLAATLVDGRRLHGAALHHHHRARQRQALRRALGARARHGRADLHAAGGAAAPPHGSERRGGRRGERGGSRHR